MNIALVNYEYPPIGGGAGNATKCLANSFKNQGHHVVVITSCFGSMRGKMNEDGVAVYRLPALRMRQDRSNIVEMLSFVISAQINLKSISRDESIDHALIFFALPCGILGVSYFDKNKIPYLISLRGGDVPGLVKEISWMHNLLKPLRQNIYDKAKSVVANSDGLQELACLDYKDVIKIPNGVDTNYFTSKPRKSTTKNILFVGRFVEQKNLFTLLKVFSDVVKHKKVNANLTMVGDGPLLKKLKAYALELGVSNNIKWESWADKSKLLELYHKADCFINISLYEGMSNAVLEAMSCGLPIIASSIMGNKELVNHGVNGFLYNLGEDEKLETYILNLLQNDEMTIEFGRHSREFVEKKFSWNNVAQRYINLFRRD